MSQERSSSDGQTSPFGRAREVVASSPSLPQRIRASTSGLLQNAFGTPSAGSVTETPTSLHSETSKGASNSSSTDVGEASSSMHFSHIREDQNAASISPTGEPFRSRQGNGASSVGTAQAAFDAFVAEPQEVPTILGTAQPTSSLDGKRRSTRPEPDDRDGAEVVALLSDPTFSVDDDPADAWVYDFSKPTDTDKVLSNTRTRPDAVESPGDPAMVNPLDLIPDFRHDLEGRVPFSSTQDDDRWPSPHSIDFSNAGSIQPWLDILHRYQDEVWGDMLPLVVEAREEIRIANANGQGALRDRPAIRRLGMLLGHFAIRVS